MTTTATMNYFSKRKTKIKQQKTNENFKAPGVHIVLMLVKSSGNLGSGAKLKEQ